MNSPNSISLNKPQHIVSLATSSILVSVDISVWTATQQDRQISDEITKSKKADRNAGRFVKHILSDDADHKRLLNYRQTVYNWLQRCTYDWSGSQRILPTISLPEFMKQYQYHEAEFAKLVQVFLDKYPVIVSNMAFKQGDMFRRSDYPDVNELRGRFSMNLYTAEVPLGDYRCQVSQALADDLFNNYSRQAERLVDQILSKQSEQLVTVMESLSHCCEIETRLDKHGSLVTHKRKIYDSTVQRALELCDTFKQFNLTSDPALEAARANLAKSLDGITLEQLRESESLRERVKQDVDSILKDIRKPDPVQADAEEDEPIDVEGRPIADDEWAIATEDEDEIKDEPVDPRDGDEPCTMEDMVNTHNEDADEDTREPDELLSKFGVGV